MQSESKIKVVLVPIPSPSAGKFTTLSSNTYLIGNEQECLLIDAGFDQEETRKELEKAIKANGLATPKSIILTHSHPDHSPGIRQLMDWSPIVYCHEKESEAVKADVSPTIKLSLVSDGDILKVADTELSIIHGPGHTPGHLSLYIPNEHILIAGDNIVAEGTTWIGAPDGDMNDYIETLNRLKKLKITKIGPGHGDWVLNPYEQIDFVINRRLHRENQIKSLLKEHGQLTSIKLTELIYENTIHPNVFEFAKRTTEAHLNKLIKENLVELRGSSYFIAL